MPLNDQHSELLFNELSYRSEEKHISSFPGNVGAKFSKDGNRFCWLLGENIQTGICGFGETAYLASLNFYNNFFKENA